MTNLESDFTKPLLAWYDSFGRKDLPWQHPRKAYYVWLSEIMLQQTQVKTVIPYFNRFVETFPTVELLANASEDKVFALWAGLGYYSRARNLHKTAQIIVRDYAGDFPKDLKLLADLPGIGLSTAAAIASQAFNLPEAILDGNVKRVLCRYFLVAGYPEQKKIKDKLWHYAKQCVSTERPRDYTQAIMDLGATCCLIRNPLCESCPLNKTCLAKNKEQITLYPLKKPKKAIPLKAQQFLVLYNQYDQIYLEKRPPTGIWGGLFSLPSLEMDENPSDFIQTNYNFKNKEISELIKIRHSFSHFHLDLHALAIKIDYDNNQLKEPSGNWVDIHNIQQFGLPKPIQDIVKYFFAKASLKD